MKVLKVAGTVLQVGGAIGGIVAAGFEIGEGINKLKEFKENQNDVIDSVASDIEVEA